MFTKTLRNLGLSLICCLSFAFFTPITAQTTLNPGDIAFTGYSADTPDQFSFVALTDISAGTVLLFTDHGWQSSTNAFRATEGVLQLTFTCDVNCGAVIVIFGQGDDMGATVGGTSIGGLVSIDSGFALSGSGDQIFAFQGSAAAPSFVAGINNEENGIWQADTGNSNDSALPPALTNGVNAVALAEVDNIEYDCTTTSGGAATLRAAINNNANWTGGSNSNFTLSAGCSFNVGDCGSGGITCIAPPNPTPLCLGDIAFTGYQSDNPDIFTFLLLTEVGNGTSITFTDNGWFADGGFRATEGTATLTFSDAYPCGTEIKVCTTGAFDVNMNSVGSLSGNLPALSASGDQVFAYQGPAPTASDETGFIAAIHMNGNWDNTAFSSNSSAQPCVFQDGVTSVSLSPEIDNGVYNCAVTAGFPAQLRAALNTASNWTTNNSTGLSFPSACNFNCWETECGTPLIMNVFASTNSACVGDVINLSVIGYLNGGSHWAWYADCCGGEFLGTGSSINVTLDGPTTFYVRGEGGCLDLEKCEGETVTIQGVGPVPYPWWNTDIGGATGSASYDPCPELFCLQSNGITYPFADKIHYAYKQVCGNSEFIARVASVDNIGFGGIMFRESLDAGSKKVAMRTQLNGAHFIQRDIRTMTNGFASTQQIFRPGQAWLRIVRTGNQFIGYTSANGSYWQFAFFANVPMNECIYVGLFAEGPNAVTTTTACFDNVYCTGGDFEGPALTENNTDVNVADQTRANLTIYPNPAQHEINVSLEDYLGNEVDLTVYNSIGQAVKVIQLDRVEIPTERIDLPNLEDGIYLLEIRSGNDINTKKFIISNN